MKIAIINYGSNNLESLKNALKKIGVDFKIVSKPNNLLNFDKVILPGVGTADYAMKNLISSGFAKMLPQIKVPTLGICLGLQLMADYSEEGNVKCLGIIPGRVNKIQTDLKIPHMGWNKVQITKKSPLLKKINTNEYFYFVHSYFLKVNIKYVFGQTTYDKTFPSVVQKNNFFATQFHPEKSGQAGFQLLKNFCAL